MISIIEIINCFRQADIRILYKLWEYKRVTHIYNVETAVSARVWDKAVCVVICLNKLFVWLHARKRMSETF